MPVDPSAAIEVTAFSWVPGFARGLVRDLRVRWALEEAGLSYRETLFDARQARPEAYFDWQPFGQVPAFRDGEVELFESGAILLYIGGQSPVLLPADPAAKARATAWLIAALSSIEPFVQELALIDFFYAGQEWTKERRPMAEKMVRDRLAKLSQALGDNDYLDGGFSVGDLMMTTVLRILGRTGMLADYPALDAFRARCEARPAFQRALAAQLAAIVDEPVAEPA